MPDRGEPLAYYPRWIKSYSRAHENIWIRLNKNTSVPSLTDP